MSRALLLLWRSRPGDAWSVIGIRDAVDAWPSTAGEYVALDLSDPALAEHAAVVTQTDASRLAASELIVSTRKRLNIDPLPPEQLEAAAGNVIDEATMVAVPVPPTG